MAIWRAAVEFESRTLMPADKVVNTFHFEGSETATDLANIDDMLSDFYNDTIATFRLTNVMASQQLTGNVAIRIFCLADPEPRLPRGEFLHGWTLNSGQSLPAEVAFCLSMQANPVSGEAQARRRGRVFLGPFIATTNAVGRPTLALQQGVLQAASALLAAAQASVTWQWVVYSRANEAAVEVQGGWVDNAWDTQRRRGIPPTDRIGWS